MKQPNASILYILVTILINIGDTVRFLIKTLIITFSYILRFIIHHIYSALRNFPKKPKSKIIFQAVKQKKKTTLKIVSTQKISNRFKTLPSLYFEGIKNAFAYTMPFIKFSFIRHFFVKIFNFIHNKIIFISEMLSLLRIKISPKPTIKHPYTIYPAPLHIAWRLQSFFAGIIITLLIFFVPYVLSTWIRSLPNPRLLTQRELQVSTKIFDRNGALLYEIYADENRTPLPLTEIPLQMQQATIAIEDRDFYKHQGFSIKGIIRASWETVIHHNIQGGSTITQQLIKSALLIPDVSIERKIREIVMAVWTEQVYSKKQILEMYLNQVPYGGTAWGVEAASQMYFGKSVQKLTIAESAFLAGLPAAPSQYSPYGSNPQFAYERQKEVIRRMAEDGYITTQQAENALSEKLTIREQFNSIQAPHFVMYIKNILEKRYGPRVVEHGGLRVRTSLDLSIQQEAESIVQKNIASLTQLNVGNGAALVTNPQTGEILAMVGSKNYFDIQHDGNVNVTTSLRQPGSSIKAVNYVAALENGFTAASILDDSPVMYQIPGSPPYAPVNYDGRYHGPTPLRYALGNSYNIPAVKLLAKIGVKTMIDKGRQMGIHSWNDETQYGLSLTLGGGDVTMLEMAEVYGTLANSGKHISLVPILEVSDYTGRTIDTFKPDFSNQAVTPEAAWIIGNILSDNTARTAAFGPNSSLVIPGKTVSVKTGTSNDKRDNWTIGYTPTRVVTVWVGNNDNSPMDPKLTSGITGAAPIWHDIMAYILKNYPEEIPQKPANIITVPCYFGKVEYFINGTQPQNGQCASLPQISPTPQQ